MSPKHDTESTLRQIRWVKSHYAKAVAIPDGPFTGCSVDINGGRLRYMNEMGLLDKTNEIRSKGSNPVAIWEGTKDLWNALEKMEDQQMPMPCNSNHSGFENTGEWLKCKDCGARFTKEEVTENQS